MTIHDPIPFADAPFRFLSHAGLGAAGIYLTGCTGTDLLATTPALRALFVTDPPNAPPMPSPSSSPAQVDPSAFGLSCGFAAVTPILRSPRETAGFLLVADVRRRRLGPQLGRRLMDAATLAGALVPESEPEPEPWHPDETRGPVRSRVQTHRLVDAALRASATGPAPTVMILDIDRFRSVNNALGSTAGDAVLAVTGARLQRVIGPADKLVRLEGDRFAVIARRVAAELEPLANSLLAAVSEPLVLRGRTLAIQACIGMVTSTNGPRGAAALLGQAESALRRAKAGGLDRCAVHEPTEAALSLDKSRLELDLAHAAQRGELYLVYQPYVDLAEGVVSGAEALIRWRHPTRGELQPLSFIPMAEATGLILPLGRWALRTALRRASEWPASTTLSVNISPLQFQQSGFLAEVDSALADTGFPAERLELEITETVLMRDNPETTAQLHALITRGIRIALDDFGTGYSALAYLARLPHHRIKLDKTFVQDLANPATAELIRAIISLARAQGIAVTAEGVERDEHLALVRRAGFTHAQGYAMGAPAADPPELSTPAPRASAS
ncbi:diguanylate cyclase (GGDEF)-like protein [Amaricoccus macauensis]|uniref:Diguanylate cyclase (GGDEF)-like protein n=1 Tax=Amaricoccus macauensis TaxID=57001 RepID=A0A840SW03_9RHOB|nr:bifunctional diguanylate cyclase/phosphodiesterase [Amaricoccus macauensis]MBB5223302.1 diguanylate cyclase (GGDEF)-like protein [Amaricoccus macauensis]